MTAVADNAYETDKQFTMYVAWASTETSCTPICYDAIDGKVTFNVKKEDSTVEIQEIVDPIQPEELEEWEEESQQLQDVEEEDAIAHMAVIDNWHAHAEADERLFIHSDTKKVTYGQCYHG